MPINLPPYDDDEQDSPTMQSGSFDYRMPFGGFGEDDKRIYVPGAPKYNPSSGRLLRSTPQSGWRRMGYSLDDNGNPVNRVQPNPAMPPAQFNPDEERLAGTGLRFHNAKKSGRTVLDSFADRGNTGSTPSASNIYAGRNEMAYEKVQKLFEGRQDVVVERVMRGDEGFPSLPSSAPSVNSLTKITKMGENGGSMFLYASENSAMMGLINPKNTTGINTIPSVMTEGRLYNKMDSLKLIFSRNERDESGKERFSGLWNNMQHYGTENVSFTGLTPQEEARKSDPIFLGLLQDQSSTGLFNAVEKLNQSGEGSSGMYYKRGAGSHAYPLEATMSAGLPSRETESGTEYAISKIKRIQTSGTSGTIVDAYKGPGLKIPTFTAPARLSNEPFATQGFRAQKVYTLSKSLLAEGQERGRTLMGGKDFSYEVTLPSEDSLQAGQVFADGNNMPKYVGENNTYGGSTRDIRALLGRDISGSAFEITGVNALQTLEDGSVRATVQGRSYTNLLSDKFRDKNYVDMVDDRSMPIIAPDGSAYLMPDRDGPLPEGFSRADFMGAMASPKEMGINAFNSYLAEFQSTEDLQSDFSSYAYEQYQAYRTAQKERGMEAARQEYSAVAAADEYLRGQGFNQGLRSREGRASLLDGGVINPAAEELFIQAAVSRFMDKRSAMPYQNELKNSFNLEAEMRGQLQAGLARALGSSEQASEMLSGMSFDQVFQNYFDGMDANGTRVEPNKFEVNGKSYERYVGGASALTGIRRGEDGATIEGVSPSNADYFRVSRGNEEIVSAYDIVQPRAEFQRPEHVLSMESVEWLSQTQPALAQSIMEINATGRYNENSRDLVRGFRANISEDQRTVLENEGKIHQFDVAKFNEIMTRQAESGNLLGDAQVAGALREYGKAYKGSAIAFEANGEQVVLPSANSLATTLMQDQEGRYIDSAGLRAGNLLMAQAGVQGNAASMYRDERDSALASTMESLAELTSSEGVLKKATGFVVPTTGGIAKAHAGLAPNEVLTGIDAARKATGMSRAELLLSSGYNEEQLNQLVGSGVISRTGLERAREKVGDKELSMGIVRYPMSQPGNAGQPHKVRFFEADKALGLDTVQGIENPGSNFYTNPVSMMSQLGDYDADRIFGAFNLAKNREGGIVGQNTGYVSSERLKEQAQNVTFSEYFKTMDDAAERGDWKTFGEGVREAVRSAPGEGAWMTVQDAWESFKKEEGEAKASIGPMYNTFLRRSRRQNLAAADESNPAYNVVARATGALGSFAYQAPLDRETIDDRNFQKLYQMQRNLKLVHEFKDDEGNVTSRRFFNMPALDEQGKVMRDEKGNMKFAGYKKPGAEEPIYADIVSTASRIAADKDADTFKRELGTNIGVSLLPQDVMERLGSEGGQEAVLNRANDMLEQVIMPLRGGANFEDVKSQFLALTERGSLTEYGRGNAGDTASSLSPMVQNIMGAAANRGGMEIASDAQQDAARIYASVDDYANRTIGANKNGSETGGIQGALEAAENLLSNSRSEQPVVREMTRMFGGSKTQRTQGAFVDSLKQRVAEQQAKRRGSNTFAPPMEEIREAAQNTPTSLDSSAMPSPAEMQASAASVQDFIPPSFAEQDVNVSGIAEAGGGFTPPPPPPAGGALPMDDPGDGGFSGGGNGGGVDQSVTVKFEKRPPKAPNPEDITNARRLMGKIAAAQDAAANFDSRGLQSRYSSAQELRGDIKEFRRVYEAGRESIRASVMDGTGPTEEQRMFISQFQADPQGISASAEQVLSALTSKSEHGLEAMEHQLPLTQQDARAMERRVERAEKSSLSGARIAQTFSAADSIDMRGGQLQQISEQFGGSLEELSKRMKDAAASGGELVKVTKEQAETAKQLAADYKAVEGSKEKLDAKVKQVGVEGLTPAEKSLHDRISGEGGLLGEKGKDLDTVRGIAEGVKRGIIQVEDDKKEPMTFREAASLSGKSRANALEALADSALPGGKKGIQSELMGGLYHAQATAADPQRLSGMLWRGGMIAGALLYPSIKASKEFEQYEVGRMSSLAQSGAISAEDLQGSRAGNLLRVAATREQSAIAFGRQVNDAYGWLTSSTLTAQGDNALGAAAGIGMPAVGVGMLASMVTGSNPIGLGVGLATAGVGAINYAGANSTNYAAMGKFMNSGGYNGLSGARLDFFNNPAGVMGYAGASFKGLFTLGGGGSEQLRQETAAAALSGVYSGGLSQLDQVAVSREEAQSFLDNSGGDVSTFGGLNQLGNYTLSEAGYTTGLMVSDYTKSVSTRMATNYGLSQQQSERAISGFYQFNPNQLSMGAEMESNISELATVGVDAGQVAAARAESMGVSITNLDEMARVFADTVSELAESDNSVLRSRQILENAPLVGAINQANASAGLAQTDEGFVNGLRERLGEYGAQYYAGRFASTRAGYLNTSTRNQIGDQLMVNIEDHALNGEMGAAERDIARLGYDQTNSIQARLEAMNNGQSFGGGARSFLQSIMAKADQDMLGQAAQTQALYGASSWMYLGQGEISDAAMRNSEALGARGINLLQMAAYETEARGGNSNITSQFRSGADAVTLLLEDTEMTAEEQEAAEYRYSAGGARSEINLQMRLSGRGDQQLETTDDRVNRILSSSTASAPYAQAQGMLNTMASSQTGVAEAFQPFVQQILSSDSGQLSTNAATYTRQMGQAGAIYQQYGAQWQQYGASSQQVAQVMGQSMNLSATQFSAFSDVLSGDPYAMSANLKLAQATFGEEAVPFSPINMETGQAWYMQDLGQTQIDYLRNSGSGQLGYFDGVSDTDLQGGVLGMQAQIMDIQRGMVGYQAAMGVKMRNASLAMQTGGGTVGSDGFMVGGDGLAGWQGLTGAQYTGNGMGMWQIEDRMTQISRSQQDMSMGIQSAQLDLADKGLDLKESQFYEKFNLSKRQFNYNTRFQRDQMQFQRGTQLQQREWGRQDLEFQDNTSELQFGWQMQDFDRNIRYARGRERVDMERQKGRAATMFSMQEGQRDKEKSRFEQKGEWEDELYNKQKDHFEQSVKFQQEEMKLQEKHFRENLALERQKQALSRASFELQKAHMSEIRALEDQQRLLQRQHQVWSVDMQNQMAMAAAGAQARIAELQNAMQGMNIEEEKRTSQIRLQLNTVPELLENMTKLNDEWDFLNDLIKESLGIVQQASADMNGGSGSSGGNGATPVEGGGANGGMVGDFHADSMNRMFGPRPKGFADGGFTGYGLKYDVAGFVHKGEYVVPQNGSLVMKGENPETVKLLNEMVSLLRQIVKLGPGRVNAVINTREKQVSTSSLIHQAYSTVNIKK